MVAAGVHIFWQCLLPVTCLALTFLLLPTFAMPIGIAEEDRCPHYKERVWNDRDRRCDPGKVYHCFEDEAYRRSVDGCYPKKYCLKGAHPVVEDDHIKCAICLEGFQPIDSLLSSKYEFTYCTPHGRQCSPEYGESLCHLGTSERNIACSCNASLGFTSKIEGENCSCFTADDACSGCKFVRCLNGSIKNDQGYCEPYVKSTTPPSEKPVPVSPVLTTTLATDDKKDGDEAHSIWWKIVIPVVCIGVILIIVLCILWKCGCLKNCKKKDENQVWILWKCGCLKNCKKKDENQDIENGNIKVHSTSPIFNIQKSRHVDGSASSEQAGHTPSALSPCPSSAEPPSSPAALPVPTSQPPPPSLPDPSVPPTSLPDPSAPLPSLPVTDESQSEEKERNADESQSEETERKIPFADESQSEKTERKTPYCADETYQPDDDGCPREVCDSVNVRHEYMILRSAPEKEQAGTNESEKVPLLASGKALVGIPTSDDENSCDVKLNTKHRSSRY